MDQVCNLCLEPHADGAQVLVADCKHCFCIGAVQALLRTVCL